MSRLTKFIRLPMHRKVLLLEALLRLCQAWVIVRKTGFTKRVPYLGTKHAGDWSKGDPKDLEKIEDVRWAIDNACAYTGHKFTCLMIGLAGKAMLRRFDIPNALVLGATRSTEPDNSEMLAHAWLRSGTMVVLGEYRMQEYLPIVSYVDGLAEDKDMTSRKNAKS